MPKADFLSFWSWIKRSGRECRVWSLGLKAPPLHLFQPPFFILSIDVVKYLCKWLSGPHLEFRSWNFDARCGSSPIRVIYLFAHVSLKVSLLFRSCFAPVLLRLSSGFAQFLLKSFSFFAHAARKVSHLYLLPRHGVITFTCVYYLVNQSTPHNSSWVIWYACVYLINIRHISLHASFDIQVHILNQYTSLISPRVIWVDSAAAFLVYI